MGGASTTRHKNNTHDAQTHLDYTLFAPNPIQGLLKKSTSREEGEAYTGVR